MVHSLTKWFGGHGTGIGGVVVDSGKFPWAAGKHPLYTTPDTSYHGLRWGIDLPDPLRPLAFILRMRTVPLRNLGACISPDNSWMFLQGIETLPLRMERHCENARAVATFLKSHPRVEWVRFPGLEGDPMFALNQKYLRGKGGAMVVFGIKGGKESGPQVHRRAQALLAPGQRRRRQEPGDPPGDDHALAARRAAAARRRASRRSWSG